MERFSEIINDLFGPMMRTIFRPTNAAFSAIPPETAVILGKVCAVGLFVVAMVWVFLLKREYVNLDAPGNKPWHDLRFWTVVSMLPHVLVYIWF